MISHKNEKLIGVFESFFEMRDKEDFIESLELFTQIEFRSTKIKKIINKIKRNI